MLFHLHLPVLLKFPPQVLKVRVKHNLLHRAIWGTDNLRIEVRDHKIRAEAHRARKEVEMVLQDSIREAIQEGEPVESHVIQCRIQSVPIDHL